MDFPGHPATINNTTIAGNGVDAAVVSNLPVGSRVTVRGGGSYIVNDGVIELTYDLPGAIEVYIHSDGYKDTFFTITVA